MFILRKSRTICQWSFRSNLTWHRWIIKVLGVPNTKRFFYYETFLDHYRYRHHINDHNKWYHYPISIEYNLVTNNWTGHVHALLIIMTEVNASNNYKYWKNYGVLILGLAFSKKNIKKILTTLWMKFFSKCFCRAKNASQGGPPRANKKLKFTA